MPLVPIFDLDGTLLDSDAALTAPFVALGIPAEHVTFGRLLEDECARLGIAVDDYLAHYDAAAVAPFPGVEELIAGLDRWAVCSNKLAVSGTPELARLGWAPDVAMFADAFDGPKQLGPVLEAFGIGAADVVFVGDTDHDRACARAVGCCFALAAWNPRASAVGGDVILREPRDLLGLL